MFLVTAKEMPDMAEHVRERVLGRPDLQLTDHRGRNLPATNKPTELIRAVRIRIEDLLGERTDLVVGITVLVQDRVFGLPVVIAQDQRVEGCHRPPKLSQPVPQAAGTPGVTVQRSGHGSKQSGRPVRPRNHRPEPGEDNVRFGCLIRACQSGPSPGRITCTA
ncbi:hypothetical protein [Arthrobacter celericrescens]|uniref:hypothetical protein n=1 Tax=Arthrobacter celericrescens TaxID=2320851 RepID=UPI0013C489AD|nr:hypothetical protein [Arthrobacter celericrescens]